MTEDEKQRDNIKQDQKALFEYLRMLTLILIGLTANAGSLFLRTDFVYNDKIILFFTLNIVILIVVILILVNCYFQIDKNNDKLKLQ